MSKQLEADIRDIGHTLEKIERSLYHLSMQAPPRSCWLKLPSGRVICMDWVEQVCAAVIEVGELPATAVWFNGGDRVHLRGKDADALRAWLDAETRP